MNLKAVNLKQYASTLVLTLLLSTSAFATESLDQLLEKGIYTEEVLGDLKSANEVYDSIIQQKDKDSALIGKAFIRKADCQLKLGDKKGAITTLNQLAELKGATEALIKDAKEKLSALQNLQDYLVAAPWVDGERLSYQIMSAANKFIGGMEFVTQSITHNDKSSWQVESYFSTTLDGKSDYSIVSFDKDNFVFNWSKSFNKNLGKVEATNTCNARCTINISKNGGYSVDSGKMLVTNMQLIHLIRSLPQQNNFTIKADFYMEMLAKLSSVEISSGQKKKITTAFGELDAWRYDVATADGAFDQSIWVVDENHKKYGRQAVLLASKGMEIQLKSFVTSGNELKDFILPMRDDRNVLIKQVDGLTIFNGKVDGVPYELMLNFVSKNLAIDGMVIGQYAPKVPDNPKFRKSIVNRDVKVLQGFFKNYTAKSELEEISINGLSAIRYYAEYMHDLKDMIEYRTYIFDKDAIYWFIWRLEKTEFEKQKPVMDDLVKSFRIVRK